MRSDGRQPYKDNPMRQDAAQLDRPEINEESHRGTKRTVSSEWATDKHLLSETSSYVTYTNVGARSSENGNQDRRQCTEAAGRRA
jgi:hypothetical protein